MWLLLYYDGFLVILSLALMLGGLIADHHYFPSSSFGSIFGVSIGVTFCSPLLRIGVGQLVCVVASKVDVT